MQRPGTAPNDSAGRIYGVTVPMEIGLPSLSPTMRRPGRRPLYQFFANLLIQLLVLSPLPADWQVRAFLLPEYLLWRLTETSAATPAPQAETGPAAHAGCFPLSERAVTSTSAEPGGISRVITSFTTKRDTPPSYDTSKLTFSFPVDGLVTVSLEAHEPPYLPAGSSILIINATNGDVSTFTVGNDGSLNGQIRASIDDRLLITITNALDGSVVTFERSQFVNAETGETAVGPGGGVVTGPGGVEIRIPEGAVDKGVRFKIEGFTLEDLPADQRQVPDLGSENGQPIAHFASGLRTTSPDKPTFKKEVDLAFPVPADAPAGSFFYVLRRIEVPNGEPMFAAIDVAKIEGEGDAARVVTQSPPYTAYTDSYGSFGTDGTIGAATVINHFLMWTYAPELLNKPSIPGVITGIVQRTKQDGTYEPIGGAVVQAKVAGQLINTFGWSVPGTGRFTFWNTNASPDAVVELVANAGGVTRTATAFDADLDDVNIAALKFYKRVSTANLTFPAVAPPPPAPAIDIRFMKVTGQGQQEVVDGILTVGTQVQVVLKSTNGTPVGAEVQGRSCSVVKDGTLTVGTIDFSTDSCAPATPGAYTITARALSNTGNTVKEASRSFLLVAGGGGNTSTISGAPKVLSVVPKNGANGIAVSVFPQVSFSEPVRVAGGITLSAGSSVVETTLLGITPAGSVVDLTANPDAPVTAVTIQPTGGLAYSTDYTLKVSAVIADLDEPPSKLGADTIATFHTFGPEAIGNSQDNFGSPGIVALEDRAYVVENNFRNGYLWAFDITDPLAPQKIGTPGVVTWRPVDMAGELDTTVAEGRLVLVATGPTNESKPSNVYAFDVSDDAAPRWVAGASVTATAQEGFITRLRVKGGVAYLATHRKGIQVLDFKDVATRVPYIGSTPDNWFVQAFNTDGQGKNQEYVRNISVTVKDPTTQQQLPAYLLDLLPVDLAFDETSDRVVLATGNNIGLLVLHVSTEEELSRGTYGGVDNGEAVAFGEIAGAPVAVVAGRSLAGRRLVTLDLTNPREPVLLCSVALSGVTTQITDLVLHHGFAVVASGNDAVVVNIVDPWEPRIAGTLAGIRGRLALSDAGLLLSTARSIFGGASEGGTVKTATLDYLALISKIAPHPVLVDLDNLLLDPPAFEYRTIPPLTTNNSTIELHRSQAAIGTIIAPVDAGHGSVEWNAANVAVTPGESYTAKIDVRDDTNTPLPTVPRSFKVMRLPLTAETRDRELEIRFAVPNGSTKSYALKVHVADAGGAFSATPTLVIPWNEIQQGYEAGDSLFGDLDEQTPKWKQPYVVRKVKRVTVPGAPVLIAQKAFAINAVFGDYRRYRVTLVELGSQQDRQLATVEGDTTYEPTWAKVIDTLSDAGQPSIASRRDAGRGPTRLASMAMYSIVAPETWDKLAGLVSRVLVPLKSLTGGGTDDEGNPIPTNLPIKMAQGFIDGFIDGAKGDWELVSSPLKTMRAVGDAFKSLRELKFSPQDMLNLIGQGLAAVSDGGLNGGQPITFMAAVTAADRMFGQLSYLNGYVGGMIAWQVVSALVVAGATAGVGAVIYKLGTAVKVGGTIAAFTGRVGRLLTILARVVEFMGERIKLGLPIVETLKMWRALLELDEVMVFLSKSYGKVTKTLEPALRLLGHSTEFGKKAIREFAKIAAMPDEIAGKLLNYMIAKGDSAGNPVFKWLAAYQARNVLQDGKMVNRAVREAMQVAPDFPNGVSEEVADALVRACDSVNVGEGKGADNLVATFVQKHRNPGQPAPPVPTEKTIRAILEGPEGAFKAETINEVIRIHTVTGAPAFSEAALTGAARLVEHGDGATDGAALLEKLIKEVPSGKAHSIDEALSKVKTFANVDSVRAFGRLIRDGGGERIAGMVANPVHDAIAERLVRAVDALRKDGKLIPGIATQPSGPGASALLTNLASATSEGSAYEVIAVHRLIEKGEFTLDQITEMGRRFPVTRIDGTPTTIEADTYVNTGSRRIFIDYKYVDDVGASSLSDRELEGIFDALARGDDIDDAVIVVKGTVQGGQRTKIDFLNGMLAEMGKRGIQVIENFGAI